MPDPTVLNVVWAAAVGATATGVTAGFAKLFSLGQGQARIEQKLDDHIRNEDSRFDSFEAQIKVMNEKLPNGELRSILEKLVVLENRFCGSKRQQIYRKGAVATARRKK